MSQPKKLPSDALELLAHALNGTKQKTGSYLCCCPCHDDREESLSLSLHDVLGVAWYCHAGCSQEKLTTAMRDILGNKYTPKESSNVVKLKTKKQDRKLVAAYDYFDGEGNVLYTRIRYEPKSFGCFHVKNGEKIYEKPDCPATVYERPKLDRLRGQAPVIICEGEKDCITLNKLLGDSVIAITNDGGAKGWTKEHQDLLTGCQIVICEHLDEAGRRRSLAIQGFAEKDSILGVFRFKPGEVPDKGDVTDWINAGHTLDELKEKLKTLEPVDAVTIVAGAPKQPPKEEKDYATYQDYVRIIEGYSKRIGKCIFTGKVMYQDADTIWKPLENKLGVIRSRVRMAGAEDFKVYSPQALNDHFEEYAESLPAKLLIDLPEWDKTDRIMEICQHIRLKKESEVTELCFMALTKEWLANVFRKLKDPSMDTSPSREFILILTGKEKIGKDYWIRSLLCGLGQYFSPMSIGHNERDNLMQLHTGLVLNLAEFDQTFKVQSSFLKDIITRSTTNIRGSYARSEEFRFSRTNFIASANISDLLRDSGQNTRYAIFELEDIKRDYKKSTEYSLQILAQAKQLAEDNFVAPSDLWGEMKEFITNMTPDSFNGEIVELYEKLAGEWFARLDHDQQQIIQERGFAYSLELNSVFKEVGHQHGISIRRVKSALIAMKYRRKDTAFRGFALKSVS